MSELPEFPQSRVEQYLSRMVGEEFPLPEVPQSRVEQYLAWLVENGGGGGEGGTNNYNALLNRPKINGVTLAGNKTLSDLGINIPSIEGLAEQEDVDEIAGKIPVQASADNKLADRAFVNSSVQTATSNFRGNWANWAAVPTDATLYPTDYAGVKTPSTNDYMVVVDASGYRQQNPLVGTWRFKYGGVWDTDGKAGWNPEYQVNETPMTADQLAALNSGVTSAFVGAITHETWTFTLDDDTTVDKEIVIWQST